MESSLCKFLAILAALVAGCHGKADVSQSLDGEWVVRETNYYYEFPGTVPGGTYTDLMNANIIGDVFYGYNDNTTRWVGQIDWSYSRNFTVGAAILEYNKVNLVFEGVDTFATVFVNNITVGETANMFVRYVFDVKSALKVGNNNVTIHFRSPIQEGLKLNNEQLRKYRIPRECPPGAYRGECHINMMRKMQASFSWDWGPAFPSIGLWKSVFLEAFDDSVIRYVVPRINDSSSDTWTVIVDTYFADNSVVNGSLGVYMQTDYVKISEKCDDVSGKLNADGEIVITMSFDVPKNYVRLWWPNGYGSQPLYDLVAEFRSSDASSISTKKVAVSFRTVELVQDDLATGATFYFKINGEPIFAKGSNEIPINVLPDLGQDPETIRYLLQSAKDVNMNMLRVWGGGVYESDYFYEVADELGIMIWQDFMFACSLYPAHDDFLNNVLAEVNHNVKRIYHHPSIVVYSGNNENEGVLVDHWYGTKDHFDLYKSDYVKLYITTIRSEFYRITKNQGVFISSSPTNGKKTESDGWIGESPGNQFWGDMHYYNYILDSWDSNTYPVPRFCSEYGYQSLPFEDSWYTATNDSADLAISSRFMDTRQHHSAGNVEMALLILENLKLPKAGGEYFSSAFIYLSQIYTSQAIRVETEHYRRYRSYLDEQGRGYTMGALYWQLNDVWVAPTWASIDFTGRWKMLHYFAKYMFANVIVTGHINTNRELQLYTVNDQLSSVEDVRVLVRVYKYDSADFTPVYENRLALNLNASASQLIQTIQTDDFLQQQNCNKTTCFFYFVAQTNTSLSDNVAISPENYVFPGKLKDSSLPSPIVKLHDGDTSGEALENATADRDDRSKLHLHDMTTENTTEMNAKYVASVAQSHVNRYEIIVTSDNIALFVWLDSHDVKGQFSENGFLQVEQSRTVWFYSDEDVTAEEIQSGLTVTHLKDPRWA